MYPPDELLIATNLPVVPDCKMDDCVASFIAIEDQALMSCSSRIDTLREWAKH